MEDWRQSGREFDAAAGVGRGDEDEWLNAVAVSPGRLGTWWCQAEGKAGGWCRGGSGAIHEERVVVVSDRTREEAKVKMKNEE